MPDLEKNAWKRGAALLILPPVLVLADSLIAYLRGWRPAGAIENGVLLAVFAALAVVALPLSLSARARRICSRYWRELLLLLISLALAGALLETGAQLARERLNRDRFFHTRGPGFHKIIRPDPELLPGITGVSHFTTGPDGIRAPGPPAPDAYRILCIGGSTTECVNLDDHETWPVLLMRKLNEAYGENTFHVGNAGISGFDTHEHLRFVRTSPLINEMDMAVFQIGINDMWRYLCGEEEEIFYNRFEMADNAPALKEEPETEDRPRPPLWTRSRLIQCWHDLRRALEEQPEPAPGTVEGIGGAEYRIRRQRRAAAVLTDNLPDLAPGLKSYARRVRDLIHACRRRDTVPVFTTQPVLWRAEMPAAEKKLCWFGWLDDGRYLTLTRLRQAMDRYNAALRRVCESENAHCIDLSGMNGKAVYFNDDCHFTEAGALEAARRIFEGLPAAELEAAEKNMP
jgi:hypothetical protein